jgi:hypothetical protein
MKALTLVELIISIVIFALIILPLFNIFSVVSRDTAHAIFLNRANIIGQSVLELITSKYFDEKSNPPWTSSSNLGPDSGESSIDDFDDVDDFNNYSQSSIPGSPGFSYSIHVYYVNPDNNWDTEVSNTTNYKRIDVFVDHPQMGEFKITTAVSSAGHGR